MWRLLFAVSWHARQEDTSALRRLLIDLVPRLLPCRDCRRHALLHLHEVKRRAKGDPKSPEHAWRWLYYLKDEVNKSLDPPVRSIDLPSFRARFALHDGHLLNDVEVADVLVLVALTAKELERMDEYAEMCSLVAPLLPVATDSLLPCLLMDKQASVNGTLCTANDVRRSRGLPPRAIKHYRHWGIA